MKCFLLTSDKFNGTVELIYNDKEVLTKIDCIQTDMNAETMHRFKMAVPVLLPALLKGEGFSAGTTIIASELTVTFEMFWKKYGKKINRKRAEGIWNKMNKTDQVNAFYGIDGYAKFLKAESWRTKLDPENYLKNRTWENEYK